MSEDKNFDALKVSPVFYWSDADMENYLQQHNLPNEWDYFDPGQGRRETRVRSAREPGAARQLKSRHGLHGFSRIFYG